jgi:hypothetical protein
MTDWKAKVNTLMIYYAYLPIKNKIDTEALQQKAQRPISYCFDWEAKNRVLIMRR